MQKTFLSYIELSQANLIHNLKAFRAVVHPAIKVVGVVKANAYGHGQQEVVSMLEGQLDYFQVDDLQELRLLRKISKMPTLVFGYVAQHELEEAITLDGILAVYDYERLERINQIAKKLYKKVLVHVKIDACLGRQGLLVNEVENFAKYIKKFDYIVVDGVYSHFANIEDTTDFTHAQKQLNAFKEAIDLFRKNGFENINHHISATSGILVYEKDNHHNALVRLGIGLYGLWPSHELKAAHKNITLKPVMRWVTHLAQIKTVPADYSIGYGLTYITTAPTKIGIIPQGYSDGYDRKLSNSGQVIINGTRCKVIGRVAMNMVAIDISHLADVRVEDEVVLLGRQGSEEISAEELAEKTGTINYEIIARISPLLPRVIKP
jgi:alanine racemase